MILVVLGTQDKSFTRLLEAVDREIEKGTIREKVIVQAGQTKYESSNMEIFDFLPAPEFDKLMDKASLVITHGGAGTILTAIKKGKKIIAAARLEKYKEHHNDHQKQIIHEFASKGYLLELRDFQKLGTMIQKCKNFKLKKFESNTPHMIQILEQYIEKEDHTAWYHKYKEGLLYLFFGGCTTLVNIISFVVLRQFHITVYVSNAIAWFLSVLFAFFTNKIFVFESRGKSLKKSIQEGVSFFGFRVLSLLFDMGIMYVFIDLLSCGEFISKVVSNVFVIIINYVFSKVFIFKK